MQSLILRGLGVACIVFALISMAQVYRHRHGSGGDVATVNGEGISQDDFYAALRITSGSQVLEKLVQQKAILQEARKDNLTVPDSDVKGALDKMKKQNLDTATMHILEEEERARLLLPRIAVKDVDDKTRHDFYNTFKDDLVQYDLSAIVPSAPEDAEAIEHDLSTGKSFEQVADTYPSRLGAMAHGKLGVQSPRAIATVLGPAALDELATLKPGQFSPHHIDYKGQPVFVKLNGVKTSYDDLKPEIDTILAGANETAVMDRLARNIKVESPYMSKPTASASTSPADTTDSPAPLLPDASGSPAAAGSP